MPAIIEFPAIVQEGIEQFGELFANAPERQHFGEYLTGLLVAERKTVSGINREFAVTTDQSCLNRWLTEVDWDAQALNEKRLEYLQRQSETRYAPHGVIAVDNTLVDHDGKHIADVGWFWDHAEQRHKIAHDYLIAQYVCPSGRHDPLEFRRFVKQAQCDAEGREFRDHTQLFQELVDWVVAHNIPGDFTFDCYFSSVDNLNHLHAAKRGYVGDLKFNRKVVWGGRVKKASEWAAQIQPKDRKRVEVGERVQWYLSKTVRLPGVEHPVRLLILWDRKTAPEPVKVLVSNRLGWEASRLLRVYRRRWTGTELFHRDGKQHLGMADCQLRRSEGQTRHMYLVFVAYSLLVARMGQGRVRGWASALVQTIGEACRSTLSETLAATIRWAVERAREDGWSHEKITTHLALA
jgi:hypothetical protein